ncbi:MAG: hypothetical protein JRJ82_12250 [Deltaproteobacteria bacterium]|nr:hypothetical protein [Deltaproteobacteria bacterium]
MTKGTKTAFSPSVPTFGESFELVAHDRPLGHEPFGSELLRAELPEAG